MGVKQGLVSTIIPVYNRAEMLEEAVQSVLSQDYRPIEVIIVDDGSTDCTWEAAQRIAVEQKGVVKVKRQQNCGPGVARNNGLTVASGQFVQYLDSDDLIHPKKFSLQVSALNAHPDCDVSYCITDRLELASGERRTWARTAEPNLEILPAFIPKRGWATLTPLWRRSICDRIGPWCDFRVLEDWEHDLRAGFLGARAIHVPHCLATIRDHGGERASGMSSGFTNPLVRDMFRAHESVWFRMQGCGYDQCNIKHAFSRQMFWISRLCAEFGLIPEANLALAYAQEIGKRGGKVWDMSLVALAKSVLGWKLSLSMFRVVGYRATQIGAH